MSLAVPPASGDLTGGASPLDAAAAGRRMHRLIERLYPICRSITGDGMRQSLRIAQEQLPALELHEVPTGTQVYDWTVPKEWNFHAARIRNSRGEVVVDAARNNLHVVNYSVPVHARMSLAELRPHLHSLPGKPDWVPYRTTYYEENWGFCLTHRQLESLRDDEYEVLIDTTLADGHLTYGELVLPGQTEDQVLLSCHSCHPSLCNDNLSGMSLMVELAQHLQAMPNRRYTYRFLFIPGTIGSITWLSRNEATVGRIRHGLVVTCVGDAGAMTYKKSRRGDATIDRAVQHVLKHRGQPYEVLEFSPWGYDERQYCSPGFDLPVGSLMRTPNGKFEQYHTSADDLDFVRPAALADSLAAYAAVLDVLENDRRYINLTPRCEPQLGRRGLYDPPAECADVQAYRMAMLWVLNLSDGNHGLLDIAERANLPFARVCEAARRLHDHGLLKV